MKKFFICLIAAFTFLTFNTVFAQETLENLEDQQSADAEISDMQKLFTQIAEKYRDSIQTDEQIRQLFQERRKEFNDLHFSGNIQKWTGKIDYKNISDNRISLRISIAPKIEFVISTDMNHPAAQKMAYLKSGQRVIFDGYLKPEYSKAGFAENSWTDKGSLENPEFDFNLIDIDVIK